MYIIHKKKRSPFTHGKNLKIFLGFKKSKSEINIIQEIPIKYN